MADPRTRRPGREAVLYAVTVTMSVVLGIWTNGLFARSWRVPLVYWGDALAGGATFKGTLENGWYEQNSALGAPMGQIYHAFPTADNMQFALVKSLGVLTDDWALASNVLYVLSYPMAAAAAAWFFRVVGLRRSATVVLAVLFAFAPYRYMHGYSHLSLSLFFVVPLGTGLVYQALTDGPLWRRSTGSVPRAWWRDALAWLTPRTLGTVAVIVVLGSTSSYYAVFVLILAGTVGVVLTLQRRWHQLLALGVFVVGVVLVLGLNMMPDLLYRGPENYLAFSREPADSVTYALTLASLVLPVPWSRFHDLGVWRLDYQEAFAIPSEIPVLGMVAGLGFLVLLLVPVVHLAAPRLLPEDVPLMRRLRALSLLAYVSFLFGTVGGLSALFALLVSPSIRAWNRIAVIIMLLALAAVGLLVQAGLDRLEQRTRARGGWRRGVAAVTGVGLLAGLGAFGLYDQVAPEAWGMQDDERGQWDSDAVYAQQVEDALPDSALVLQLPFLPFPESPPVYDLHDYDPMRLYLHTQGLRWTYGGLKGLPTSSWSARVAGRTVEEMLLQSAAVGVGGISVDRFGFPGRDTRVLEKDISEVIGAKPLVSPDERYSFFDIEQYAQAARDVLGPSRTQAVRQKVLRSPEIFYQEDFPPAALEGDQSVITSVVPNPVLTVGNPGLETRVRLSFLLRVAGSTSRVPVSIRFPDGEQRTVQVDPGGASGVVYTFQLPRGSSTIALAQSGGTSVSLIGLSLSDVELDRTVQRALLRSDE